MTATAINLKKRTQNDVQKVNTSQQRKVYTE